MHAPGKTVQIRSFPRPDALEPLPGHFVATCAIAQTTRYGAAFRSAARGVNMGQIDHSP